MRNLALCFTLTFLLAAFAAAQTPEFDFPYFISTSSGQVMVYDNVYDIPHAGDWDEDGDIDLLVGVFYSGNIFYYENTAGPGVEPEFADYSVMMADGAAIQVTYG